MSVLNKRNLLFGIATIVIAVGATAAIWGVPNVMKRSTATKGQVTAYLLDDRGAVNGLLLASGDQLHFSTETGAIVASQIKVGDEVTATGKAGSQTSYGREVKVEQLTANGRTILAVHGGSRKQKRERGPKAHAERSEASTPTSTPAPVTTESPSGSPSSQAASPGPKEASTASTSVAAVSEPTPEVIKVTGTIRTHIVNGHGDVNGLMLSGGEQVRFSPKVGKLVVSAEQGPTTEITVEGTVIRNERGTVLSPTYITVGNQTIALTADRH